MLPVEVKDIAGLSEPFCKILDVIVNGINSSPRRYKRIERAKIQIAKEKAAQERDKMLKDALALQLRDRLNSPREIREWKNVVDVIGVSADILSTITDVNEDPVDPDWSARFFDYIKNCSDETVKNLWAQILAGEIRTPGSFSLRTLDMLRNLSKSDAETIVKYAHRVSEYGFISFDVPALDVAKLVDIGFINGSPLHANIDAKIDEQKIIYHNRKWVLTLIVKEKAETGHYDVHSLTQPGREIVPLIDIVDDDAFLHDFAKKVKKSFHQSISIAKHVFVSQEGDMITYSSNPIWVDNL